jgi:hypothetical protein
MARQPHLIERCRPHRAGWLPTRLPG